MASENGRVHPNCVNASNPYHECGMACLEKIAQGQGQGHKDIQKKKLGSWSFGRKSKESGSRPESPRAPRTPRVVDKVAVGGQKADAQRARSEYQPNKNVESENGKSLTSSEHFSREIRPEDHSFNKEKVLSTQAAPPSENVKMSDRSKDRPKENFTSPTGASPWTPSKNGKDDKVQASHHEIYDSTEDVGEYIPSPTGQTRNFSFLGIDHITPGDSDDEEAQSVISDCVSVGKYHVRASISSILQSIINKYGDIAANCKLESNSMRAYYLECLCSVIQELQSTSLMQMTKAKVREMLAVLKDVESAQIDVDWLRNILNEISEAIELRTQHQTIDAAKASCDNLLESTKKELESRMQELALKEKEVADLKERVAETESRLSNLEFESNQLEQTIQATQSKVNKYSHKSLANEIL